MNRCIVLVLAAAGCVFAQVSPCVSNRDCPEDSYCSKPEGQCDGMGVCSRRPQYCIDAWIPVCGCDGQTYGNSCYAARAGVNVAYEGPCKKVCTSDLGCGLGQYCFFSECVAEMGVCLARPQACPDLWAPVCGCNGKTYGNACEAAAAGVSIEYSGECIRVCSDHDECSPDRFCRKEPCQAAEGVCVERPLVCPKIWAPVCGCNGQTYANACEAHRAGVNVDYEGLCVTPRVCGSAGDCWAEEYCRLEACGDPLGLCSPRPQACPDVWAPVCGCDGMTYSNACHAAALGMSVAYEGACAGAGPGPRLLMQEPMVLADDVHSGATGVGRVRFLWSESVEFAQDDVYIVDGEGQEIPFTAVGTGTPIMTILFPDALLHDRFTIVISDNVTGIESGLAIDGDEDGAAGGEAIRLLEHRSRADLDDDNAVALADLAILAQQWLWER